MPSCFWKSSLTREWPFVTSMLFTFSRKNFENPVKFYFLKIVVFHIVKSFLLTTESSKASLFTGQLFQGIKLKNLQEYQEDETRIRSRIKNQGKRRPTQGKTASGGTEVRPKYTAINSFSKSRTQDSSKSSVVLLNHVDCLRHYMLITCIVTYLVNLT